LIRAEAGARLSFRLFVEVVHRLVDEGEARAFDEGALILRLERLRHGASPPSSRRSREKSSLNYRRVRRG
jgi:hypothetical protein